MYETFPRVILWSKTFAEDISIGGLIIGAIRLKLPFTNDLQGCTEAVVLKILWRKSGPRSLRHGVKISFPDQISKTAGQVVLGRGGWWLSDERGG